MDMIHLIVLDTVEFGKVTFVIENISVILYSYSSGTEVYTTDGTHTRVSESVEEITKRINQIVYGTEK